MISFPALLALTLPEYPTLAESLQYQLTGFLVVAFTLGSLALLVGLVGRIFATADARRAAVPAASAPPQPATPAAETASEEIPSAVLAAISGAVAAALGDSRFAIRGVQVADPRQNLAWSAEGRRSIYASRNVR
jgi:hypothetical protein